MKWFQKLAVSLVFVSCTNSNEAPQYNGGKDAGQAGEDEGGTSSHGAGGESGTGGNAWSHGGSAQGGSGTGGEPGPSLSCEDVSFAACGGDPVGNWNYELACISGLSIEPGTAFDECPEATASFSIDLSGTVSFTSEGNYNVVQTVTEHVTVRFPKSCLQDGAQCGDYQTDGAIVIEDGDNCVMTTSEVNDPQDNTGTYTTGGNEIYFDNDPQPGLYCATSDSLMVQVTEEEVTITYVAVPE